MIGATGATAGVHRRDSGDLLLEGQSVDFTTKAESMAAGSRSSTRSRRCPGPVDDREHLHGTSPPRRRPAHRQRATYAEAERLFTGLGVLIDPRGPALALSIADQQIIEIAKAIPLDAKVMIMGLDTLGDMRALVRRTQHLKRSSRTPLPTGGTW